MKSQLLGLVVAAALSPGFAAAQTDATTANDLDAVKEIHKSILSKLEAKTEAEMKIYTNTIPGAPVKYAMVPIPSGEFTMGSPDPESGRKHPVTRGHHPTSWSRIGGSSSVRSSDGGPGSFPSGRLPV